MPDPIYLTAEGLSRLRIELAQLKGERRDELAARLRSAIQMGDLSENADYHKAKEDQAFLEGRIQELEYLVGNAVVIPEGRTSGIVAVGSRVTLREEDFPEETYHLVGPAEADPRRGKISHDSPIGRALLGQKAGDTVETDTPAGRAKFKILKVE